jgi:ABC-type lipoprotein release transport system permease subunit
MQTLLADLRIAFRMLAKRPGYASVAILALALGIGANTAVFSVIRGVILRPLPYADPSQLVAIWVGSIGIYGVISYNVTESTKELGIRLALGALKSDILKMVLDRGLKLVLLGIGLGAAASLALTRMIASFLFNVSPSDPVTFAAVAGIFVMVALAASLIPALRATKVDPMVALHYE